MPKANIFDSMFMKELDDTERLWQNPIEGIESRLNFKEFKDTAMGINSS